MYIVTGGAGFIGSALVGALNALNHTEILVVDELGADGKWQNLSGKRFIDFVHKDEFLRQVKTDSAWTKVKGIIHMGACSSTLERNVDFLMENNYRYTLELANFALRHNIRFIYASSAATYGAGELGYSDADDLTPKLKPLNPYGFSKQTLDLWVLAQGYQNKIAGLKFFNVYGPGEEHKGEMRSVVLKAYQQIKQTGKVKLFKSYRPEFADGEQKRDFIYVKDCSAVMCWLLDNPKVNGIFNLGSGQARTWNSLVEAVFKALKLIPNIEYIEMPEELRAQYQYFTQAEMRKLEATQCPLKFNSLESGVTDYVQNYLEQSAAK